MAWVADWYGRGMDGPPRKLVALHLIVTPEYLRRMTTAFPDMAIYALRLDRGASDEALFETVPGTSEAESGLDEHGYILPGAGGLGEVINNSFV